MKEQVLISLVAIALVSGCTGIPGITDTTSGTSVATGSGLAITSFSAEPSTLYNGSTVRLSMEVQNLGDIAVSNSDSCISLMGANLEVGSETNNQVWHRLTGDDITQSETFDRTTMRPADTIKGTPADIENIRWNLKAPDLQKGQTRTDTFIGRVYSKYQTIANGNIWIYSEVEADASSTAGTALNTATFTSTTGPVAIDVSVTPNPVIVYDSDRAFTMTIRLSNAGSGTIYDTTSKSYATCPPSIELADLNKVKVTVEGSQFEISGDCKKDNSYTTTQELISGKPVTMICDMIAPETTTLKTAPLTVTATYGYYTQAETSVTVQGK
jgi:hypothetical protein